MKINQSILFSLCLTGMMMASPAYANNLNDGIHFYKAKDYLSASRLLEKAVSESPRNWRAHYYLANAQMALGRFNTATYHYELVRDMAPNKTIQQQAGLAIVKMENLKVSANISSVVQDHNAQAPALDREAQVNQNKKRIIAEGEAKAKAIELAADRQIKAEKANSNFWMITPQGEQVMTIPWEREQSIRQEAANNASHIRQTAQRSADAVY